MIIEDYVSFKTAKLLKEKGFDEECIYVYRHDGSEDIWDADKEDIACQKPTLQMAVKWLREVHNITIGITFSCDLISYEIQKNGEFITSIGSSRTYEQMVEEAIQLCVKTLI